MHAVGATAQRTAEPYDFRRPTTLAREHSRILEAAFDSFARQWGTQLTAKVRTKSTATTESVIVQTYDEYTASLPTVTCMVRCVLGDTSAKMVVQFPTPVALGWVARMLGGSSDKAGLERKLTPIEHALVKAVVEESLDVLAYALGPLLPAEARVESIQYNSQFAQAAAPSDLMVVVTCGVQVGETTSPVTFAIPADTLLPQLGAVNPVASSENAAELTREQVAQVPVEVTVRLASVAVTPEQVLTLAVGDTLPLPHHAREPFHVTVEGQDLARAMVVRSGARAAAQIVSLVPAPAGPALLTTPDASATTQEYRP
ncbi:flagellar motor switch protein FliM [Intrasporangium sp. YIM S08009]|uniref:flagellar motor switch protein FliM n=1 Tax=Intrasporangium zincisolvens TaxID=3080018 RepID=UPI002B0545C7|nr:flagellar motor switch protein FliM [Intrasporangium sp. YIM S08009]